MQEAGWLAKKLNRSFVGYVTKIDRHYQCPRCWVRDGLRSDVRPVTSGTDDHDILRCDTCSGDFIIPLRE